MCSMRRDGTANHPTTSDNAIRFVWCHPIKKRSVGGRLLWSGVMCMCMCKCMCADVRCLIGFSKQYLTFSLDFDRRCSFTMRFQLAQPFVKLGCTSSRAVAVRALRGVRAAMARWPPPRPASSRSSQWPMATAAVG
jgi:hypothetical protein